MSLRIGYDIEEYYEDGFHEAFGHMTFEFNKVPNAGDRIMLKWLDGTDAYEVDVVRKHLMTCRLDVKAVS